MKFDIKKILPHFGAALVFFVAACLFFAPIVFQGLSLSEHDNVESRGMQSEIHKYNKENGELIKWTNQTFIGMPTYQLETTWGKANPIQQTEYRVMRMGKGLEPYLLLYLLMLGAYIAMMALNIPMAISIALALAYGFLTSHMLYFPAGHSTKLLTIAYISPAVAFFILAYRGKILLGSSFFALFLAMQLNAKHVQMTYYMFLGFIILGIAFLIDAIQKKELPVFAKATGALLFATILGVSNNLTQIWTTIDYVSESTRGQSDLTGEHKRDGLAEDYVYAYSFEKSEVLTLMFPNFYGSSDMESFVQDKEGNLKQNAVLEAVQNPTINQGFKAAINAAMAAQDRQAANRMQGLTQYRGSQQIVGGPLYYGTGLCFLFIVALIFVTGSLKFGMIAMLLFFATLAMGDNFPVISDLMYNNFPMYNKFRDTKMVFLVAQAFVLLFAALGIKNIVEFKKEDYSNSIAAKFLTQRGKEITAANLVLFAWGVGSSICLLLLLYSFVGAPEASYDTYLEGTAPQLLQALYVERCALIRTDALVGFVIISILSGALYLFANQKFSATILAAIIGAVLCIDELRIDTKHITENSYKPIQEVMEIQPSAGSVALNNQDKTYYRVIDFSHGAPSQTAEGCYFHKHTGGYHAAKPRLYQDLWKKYDLDNPNAAMSPTGQALLGMVNAKYYLFPPNPEAGKPTSFPYPNPAALGHAWFVNEVKTVANSDEEIETIGKINPKTTAITQNAAYVGTIKNTPADGDLITLKEYHPERMTYEAQTANGRFALFSEMYYPPQKGWNVYINGKLIEGGFIRCNYLIRGLQIPAGKSTIEMKFEPTSYSMGELIASISGLLIFAMIGFFFYRWLKPTAIDNL